MLETGESNHHRARAAIVNRQGCPAGGMALRLREWISGDTRSMGRLGRRKETGDDVILRAVIALGLSGSLVACSNDRSMLASFAASPLIMPAAASGATASINSNGMPKKTMSDKVLAAMALERVTGMKADPDRLMH